MANKKSVMLLKEGSLRETSDEVSRVYINTTDALSIKLAFYFILEEFERDFPYFCSRNYKDESLLEILICDIFGFNQNWDSPLESSLQVLDGFKMDKKICEILSIAIQGGVTFNFLEEYAVKVVCLRYIEDQELGKDMSKFDLVACVEEIKAYYVSALRNKGGTIKKLLKGFHAC